NCSWSVTLRLRLPRSAPGKIRPQQIWPLRAAITMIPPVCLEHDPESARRFSGRSCFAKEAGPRGDMDKDKLKAFADKVFGDMAGAMTAGMGYIGVKTGLFRAMAGKGGMRVEDVARETKLVPRYVEEWLKGMTSAKYLDYDPATQTYRLPDEHAYLLASDDTDHFMGGLFPIVPVLLRLAPDVAVAFERGGGVPFEKFGPEGVF